MDADELRQRIAAFPRWAYRFEFDGGVSTPVGERSRINRQRQRHAYFFSRLLALSGGTLRGLRVLDLGCNAGFWALGAIEAGAEFVAGIDFKQEYIDQAQLVFEANAIAPERYRFERRDIFSGALPRDFDVVLCLGVLGHTDRPVELFELIAATGVRLVVIDTNTSRARLSLFELSRQYGTSDLVGDGLVLVPSRQAVVDLADRHGFATVALAPNWTDLDGIGDYRRERRRAFICARGYELGVLPAERRAPLIPWWIRDPRALLSV
ncbi:MAG TPA: methyltransferase domain-containing protein [Solirubrobacteraceae bacterium]|jgi:SAM-dependent methyltransferase|nr:methyltransferase domain-containing protein [Solirubrobacteraceae bacterium]